MKLYDSHDEVFEMWGDENTFTFRVGARSGIGGEIVRLNSQQALEVAKELYRILQDTGELEEPENPLCPKCKDTGKITWGTKQRPCPNCQEGANLRINMVDDKPKCATCEDTGRVKTRLNELGYGTSFVDCPDCGESGEGKLKLNTDPGPDYIIPSLERFKNLEDRLGIAETKIEYDSGTIHELKKRLEVNTAGLKKLEEAVGLDLEALTSITDDLRPKVAVLEHDSETHEVRLQEVETKVNERISKSKAWSEKVDERLRKLEGLPT